MSRGDDRRRDRPSGAPAARAPRMGNGALAWRTLFLGALLFLLSADLVYVPIGGQKIKYGYFLVIAAWGFAPRRMLEHARAALRRLPWYVWLPLPPLALSVALSTSLRDSLGWSLWFGFDAFTVLTIYAYLKASAFSGDQVRRAVVLALAGIAACGIAQFASIYLFGRVILQPQLHFDVYRINGVAGWPHFLNIFSFLLLPLVLVQRRLTLFPALVMAALVFVLVQSTAKTGWVLFIALGCLLLVLDRRVFGKSYLVFLVPITVVALLVPQPSFRHEVPPMTATEKISRFSADLNIEDQTTSGTDRVLIGVMGLKVWARHPWFGVGPRAYDNYVYTRFDRELAGENKRGADHAIIAKNENIWVEWLAENGILFTLAFGFVVARALWVRRWEFGNRLKLGAWIALVLYFTVSGQFSQTGLLTMVYAVFGIYFYASELRPQKTAAAEVYTVLPEHGLSAR
jgi:O-antigen ligase